MKHPYEEFFADNNIVVVQVYERSYDRNNEPFITLTSGGVKREGDTMPVLFASESRAWSEFEDVLLTWLKGRRQLYIRHFPEIRNEVYCQDTLHDDWRRDTYYVVYCRLTAY